MREIVKPTTSEQVLDIVRWAVSDNVKTLEIVAQGTKQGLGRALNTDVIVNMSDLTGITMYEAEELVMSARAGTPLAEIQAALDNAGQMLAFEPWQPDHLYGVSGGTVGGMFSAAMTGPRRPLVGSARDHVLGFHAVSGRGEVFKSGGRVVKNVTGFDLPKLMTGAMGTLGIITDVTFKVLPKPEKSRTVLIVGADDPGQVMREAQNSAFEVSGVAYLPQSIAMRSAVSYVADANASVTAVRVEGPEPSVKVRCESLRKLLGGFGRIEELHTTNTTMLWQEIRDVAYFDIKKTAGKQIWRLSVVPSEGIKIARALGGEYFIDWAGGLIWLALDAQDDGSESMVRGTAGVGHATLMRADASVRAHISAFQPHRGGMGALIDRVHAGFDPHGILNPGRL